MRRRAPRFYKLIGRLAAPCGDLLTWGLWLETANLRVACDEIGPYRVSTVFLGLDHNFEDHGDPLLFETMLLGDGEEYYQVRTSTWGAAERAHDEALRVARERFAAAQALLPESWGGSESAR